MHLNRPQLAFIITALTLGILILTLFNIHLGAEQEEEYVIEMSLADEDLEKMLEEEEQQMEEMEQSDPIESHMAFNETAKPSMGNPEPLKTLEELLEERTELSEEGEEGEYNEPDSNFSDGLKELARKREERLQQLGEKDAQKKEYTNNLAKRRTSVSFSLVDRTSYRLPPPIYTCIEGGTVVINIDVDSNGYVTAADYNAKSSNTSNGCLVDNAITYALRARFNPDSKSSQIGTITYIFQSK
ncbi:hypothetical protein PP178_06040 [Zeaxanthinibacter sp. PT1]|uniref:hypothetical protein n=1 Tax=Zeaxanthinibacter TaxID=561554 RepID=UPI00234AC51A|nr:hypothetical protein [Zeaxanthinibacter sp. PT1]MDC6351107.1 hypothetical protein [Zeaxanthinibacter sp. PT1]